MDNKTLDGTLKTFANGYELYFQNSKYYISDIFGNLEYITNWNNREKVFDFIKKYDFDINFADSLLEIEKLIKTYFKR